MRKTVSESTSEFLREAMLAMVDEQTPWSTAIPGYEIGGKTGTAEKQPRSDKKYVVSFASFVPASNPEYFMMVVIDEPDVEDQSTGGYATTLTHDLWVDILPYLNLFPTRDTGEETQPSTENVLQEPGQNTPEEPEGENLNGENPNGENPDETDTPEGALPEGENPDEPEGEGYSGGIFQGDFE